MKYKIIIHFSIIAITWTALLGVIGFSMVFIENKPAYLIQGLLCSMSTTYLTIKTLKFRKDYRANEKKHQELLKALEKTNEDHLLTHDFLNNQ